ncbi:MAG: hypothetical protein JXQ99_16010 [Hyphomicrobiaceae bacterium]
MSPSLDSAARLDEGDTMSESENHIEKLHTRLQQMAAREQALIDALNEALSTADRKLLDDVRSVTADHEARRVIIMSELQTLAERIGMFPASDLPVETIEYEEPAVPTPQPVDLSTDDTPARGGDWRKAAKKITDGLDFHLNGVTISDTTQQAS